MRRDIRKWTLLAALALLPGCRSGAPDAAQPVAPAARLRGSTETAYPVALAGANAELERAYGAAGAVLRFAVQ